MTDEENINESDFQFEFYAEEFGNPALEEELRLEADSWLRALAEGHRDMIGASVAVEKPVEAETDFVYRARVVAYIKPDNIASVEKAGNALTALKGALDAVELQVRERRNKISEPWKKPESGPSDHIV